jgi:pimeloyl-ACP methyl ester carboxylesterase
VRASDDGPTTRRGAKSPLDAAGAALAEAAVVLDGHDVHDVGEELADAATVPRVGPVVWKRTWVQDRPAHYGIIGDGLPVLFVHGWALGQHSYRAVLHRLAAHGCRVIAPALPGFGGTPDLPRKDFHLAGYAAWLEAFLDAIDVEEKVVIVGHSFGGGVAIRTAYDYPEVARSLVLVNSIGGSSWRKGKVITSIAERPLWDWGLHLPTDVWPIRQATRVLPVIMEDAVPNLVRNPRSVVRVANLARRADLRPELEELKRRELPVTVVWGNRDGIIPRESFDALCTAVGTAGTVVEGSHSWLLADPGRFVEVITNDLEVAKRSRDIEQRRGDTGTNSGTKSVARPLRRLLGRPRRPA